MNVCSRYPCGWVGGYCTAPGCPNGTAPTPFLPMTIPSPRTMPVNVPFSTFGVTIVIMNSKGEITIKVEQPDPALTKMRWRMTREQATELVEDLIQACWDYENNTGRRTYREDYLAKKEHVIAVLAHEPPK